MQFDLPLPIDSVLDELGAALAAKTAAVLVAPPGAGKTTRVPLALLDAEWLGGRKILVLEPRRLAARAAAERMAHTLGERVGETIGLRARLTSKSGPRTRIEVITEGVFTRMILDDPGLEDVGAVLFDEFHERSLDADLGLALALDAKHALREDLRLLVMSATLDGARVADLLGDAPVIRSEGRAYPVNTRYLGRDPQGVEDQMAAAILRALRSEPGSVLAFLPGQREIRRVADRLAAVLDDPRIKVVLLHGGLDMRAQDAAVAAVEPGHRKVVLATAIAETSLTIEGVRIVVDSGLARVPRYEPGVGITRLVTVRASRASVDQRRGRAGRTEPGVCYRLWDEPATASLPQHAEPEIHNADLSGLLLDCAAWGVTDPRQLMWLDPPVEAPLSAARAELQSLGALDADGRVTALGRMLRSLPLPPRLARMVLAGTQLGAADEAADIAAILVERGLGGSDTDMAHRLADFRRDRSQRARAMRSLARGWARAAKEATSTEAKPPAESPSTTALLALAYPDRIAKSRGAPGQYLLANGRGATLDRADPLARKPFLVVAELQGAAAAARILLAAATDEEELLQIAGDRVAERDEVTFERELAALRARRVRRLGAIVLSSEPRPVPSDLAPAKLADGIAAIGIHRLPWTKAQQQLRDRVQFLRSVEPDTWPDLSDEALAASARDWLAPFLAGRTRLDEITADDLAAALDTLLPWSLRRRLDAEAPTHFVAPTGHSHAVRYDGPDAPALHIRVQELFGLDQHPAIAGGRLPLTLHLLSPGHRPIQITRDLPGFWRGSWAAVKAEMKGRFPKHPWPDEPVSAKPTARAKPRAR